MLLPPLAVVVGCSDEPPPTPGVYPLYGEYALAAVTGGAAGFAAVAVLFDGFSLFAEAFLPCLTGTGGGSLGGTPFTTCGKLELKPGWDGVKYV